MAFEIDYIFRWVLPEGEETHFGFWVSPATLVFENVYDFNSIFHLYSSLKIEIDSIKRVNPSRPLNAEYIEKATEWEWVIDCDQGETSFHSADYKLFVREKPVLLKMQTLETDTRNISFDRNCSP